MRVLHIVAPGEVGGLERVVQLLAQGQARAGAKVHVAVVLEGASGDHALVDFFAPTGVTPHPIVIPPRTYWRERAAILDLGRRLQPDVVQTHGCRPDVVDAPAARPLGIPTVTTGHGLLAGDWRKRPFRLAETRSYPTVDAVITASPP